MEPGARDAARLVRRRAGDRGVRRQGAARRDGRRVAAVRREPCQYGAGARQIGHGNRRSLCRAGRGRRLARRSEEHTSELQSLMRISYAVFCLKKKNKKRKSEITITTTASKTERHHRAP